MFQSNAIILVVLDSSVLEIIDGIFIMKDEYLSLLNSFAPAHSLPLLSYALSQILVKSVLDIFSL